MPDADQLVMPQIQEFTGKLKVTVQIRFKLIVRRHFPIWPLTAPVHIQVVVIVQPNTVLSERWPLYNDTLISVSTPGTGADSSTAETPAARFAHCGIHDTEDMPDGRACVRNDASLAPAAIHSGRLTVGPPDSGSA